MASLPNERSEAQTTNANEKLTQPENSWDHRIDAEQMFILIDGILPFEACLYYQVLPLSLEGSRLNLGMVTPDDPSATEYVRRILSYMNCSLVPRLISFETHHSMLSAYLNRSGKKQASSNPYPEAPKRSVNESRLHQNNQATLIVDSPDELNNFEEKSEITEASSASSSDSFPPLLLQSQDNQESDPDFVAPESFTSPPFQPPPPEVPPPPPEVPVFVNALPVLEIQAENLSSPVEVLATLQPKELLQELLGRILVGGIGRLYLERQQRHGRILWSQNGVLQSVLEELPLTRFQGVINELKLLTQLPLITVEKTKQVEIERLYQQTRLLLRFRVMPGAHGEEATLQVLRGAALKFYQQQQLTTLGRDALNMGQQLQRKISEIRDRARSDSSLSGSHLDSLPALRQLLRHIDQQIRDLQTFKLKDEDPTE